jgi:hypothetical protein
VGTDRQCDDWRAARLPRESAGEAATSAWSARHHNGHYVLLASTRPPLDIPLLPLLFYFFFDDLDAVTGTLDAGSAEVTPVGHPPHALGGEVKAC